MVDIMQMVLSVTVPPAISTIKSTCCECLNSNMQAIFTELSMVFKTTLKLYQEFQFLVTPSYVDNQRATNAIVHARYQTTRGKICGRGSCIHHDGMCRQLLVNLQLQWSVYFKQEGGICTITRAYVDNSCSTSHCGLL